MRIFCCLKSEDRTLRQRPAVTVAAYVQSSDVTKGAFSSPLLFLMGFEEADYEGCYSYYHDHGLGEHEDGFGAERKGDHC